MQCGGAMQAVEQGRRSASNSDAASPRGGGIVHKTGVLFKKRKLLHKLVPRWYVFHKSFLYVYSEKSSKRPKHVIFLDPGCIIREIHDEFTAKGYHGFEIEVETPGDEEKGKSKTKMQMYAKTTTEMQDWIRALKHGSMAYQVSDFYSFQGEIGSGRFSSVRKGMNKQTKELCAIKVISKDTNILDKEALRTEIAILKMVRHPFIVHMKDIFESQKTLYIVMPLFQGGDLFYRIVKRKRFPEATARIVMWKLLSAVRYLHDRGVVHRDLKPENVLMNHPDDDTSVILADFGLSKFATPAEIMKNQCGTLSYLAPEVLLMRGGYGKAVDLWSLGIICYLLHRGGLPFDGKTKEVVVQKTLHGKLSFSNPCWKKVTKDARDLIEALLTRDPESRITVEAALSHKWFDAMTDEEKRIPYEDVGPSAHSSAIGEQRWSLAATSPLTPRGSGNYNTNLLSPATPASLLSTASPRTPSTSPDPTNGDIGDKSPRSLSPLGPTKLDLKLDTLEPLSGSTTGSTPSHSPCPSPKNVKTSSPRSSNSSRRKPSNG